MMVALILYVQREILSWKSCQTAMARPVRVLGVEDNAVNQFVLRSILELIGADAAIVENGEEAIAAWEAANWDLILMDIQMPVMDGIDATREIRRREAQNGRSKTPIVAVTANVISHQTDRYFGAGMDDLVSKPDHRREIGRELLDGPGHARQPDRRVVVNAVNSKSPHGTQTGHLRLAAAIFGYAKSYDGEDWRPMALDPERYAGLANFRYALRSFVAASEAINRDAGITQQQYQALLTIKARPAEAIPVKELAEQLLLTHHAAVQMINRLAKLGLAQRTPSSEDRRSVLVSLTPNGETLVEELATKHLAEVLRQEPLLTTSLAGLKRLRR